MSRAWIVLAAAALVAGVWWWRRGAPEPSRSDVATGPVHSGTGAAPARSPGSGARPGAERSDRPAIVPVRRPRAGGDPAPPADEPVPVPGDSGVSFDREVRDPAWAVDQERELGLRLEGVNADLADRGLEVTVRAVECRRTLCRIDLGTRGSRELSAMYGALETPDGLYGWADAIVLGQVEGDPLTGALTTSVLVQFER